MRVDEHSYFSAGYSIICNTQGLVRALLWFLPFCFSHQAQEGVLNLSGIQLFCRQNRLRWIFSSDLSQGLLAPTRHRVPRVHQESRIAAHDHRGFITSQHQLLSPLPRAGQEAPEVSWKLMMSGESSSGLRQALLWNPWGHQAVRSVGSSSSGTQWLVEGGGLGSGPGEMGTVQWKAEPVTLWFPGRKYLEEGESLFFFFLAVLGRHCSSLQCSGFSLRWLLLSRLVGSRAQTQ